MFGQIFFGPGGISFLGAYYLGLGIFIWGGLFRGWRGGVPLLRVGPPPDAREVPQWISRNKKFQDWFCKNGPLGACSSPGQSFIAKKNVRVDTCRDSSASSGAPVSSKTPGSGFGGGPPAPPQPQNRAVGRRFPIKLPALCAQIHPPGHWPRTKPSRWCAKPGRIPPWSPWGRSSQVNWNFTRGPRNLTASI